MRGIGDVVAKITSLLNIEPCDKCKQRQKLLNKTFPFMRKMTWEQMRIFERLVAQTNDTIDKDLAAAYINLYNDVFKQNRTLTDCSKCIQDVAQSLTRSYEIS